jgi:hypothetical protein
VAKKMMFTKESSPFDSSPFNNSPRLFWKEQTISPQGRFGSENDSDREPSLSPKRSSIENLKKASRVKNSSMFAREQKNEYDPTSVQPLDRPLAAGRPLATQVQGNAYGGSGLTGLRKQNDEHRSHRRGESLSKIPTLSPSKTAPGKLPTQSAYTSPVKENPSLAEGRISPSKSSLVSPGRFTSIEYNPDSSMWSEDEELKHQTPRPLRRHAKSVTFDAAPPTINEYEMVTPDPSSIASGSREGSYESQDDEDMSFDQDDSFDASLEDTDKTPVVLPEDWRHMSPEAANASLVDNYDDVFDGRDSSPMPNARPGSVAKMNGERHGSTTSDGESRPLPPLPGMQAYNDSRRRDSSVGLSAAAERASGHRRSLPLPPQAAGISKSDLLNMREGSMSLEDRLRLMNFDDDRNTDTPTQESQDKKLDQGLVQVQVSEIEVTETEITIEGPKVPRISRESILRKVKSRNFDEYDSYNYDAESSPERSYGDLADLDPDVPIPSREASSNFDDHPPQNNDDDADSVLDAYSMAETTEMYTEISRFEDYERESSVIHHEIKEEAQDEDDASQYSSQPEEQPTSQSTIDTSGPPTPTALDTSPPAGEKEIRAQELFSAFNDSQVDFQLDPLKTSFETAPSPLDTAPKIGAMREFLRRPETPEAEEEDAEIEDPGTPDSVIRHPMVIEPPEQESSPAVPEQVATIKGAGGRLKTRPSLIPEDLDMAATRRQVSGERPPPVPERSPKRQSLSLDFGHIEEGDSQGDDIEGSKKDKLTLDLAIGDDCNDLSFGLDKEFDHIIEAQKVDDLFPLPSFARFPTSTAAQTPGASHMCGEGFVYTYSPTDGYVREQKGYLMRQNTKVVVASSRQFSDEKPASGTEGKPSADKGSRSANSSPRKTSAERKPAWTTEPWNPKVRRRSIRTTSAARRAAENSGPAPPLPGQESAVAGGLGSVDEQNDEEFEDGAERGRLFVKVVGVKDLDLPLPKSEFPPAHFKPDCINKT